MLKFINDILNKTTMYKVMTYGLFLIAIQGIALSWFDFLSFDPLFHFLTLFVFVFACWISNEVIAKLLKVQVNSESAAITSLILFLIIQPASNLLDLLAIFLISLFAMAAKYIFVVNRMHIFNPAALAALFAAFALNYYATWWVGSMAMLPLVLIVGTLIVKKVKRFQMVGVFIISALVSALYFNTSDSTNYLTFIYQIFTSWPIIFFAAVMLTEPLTMPGTRKPQLIYSLVIGLIFGSKFHLGPIYNSPELALVIGNLGSFILLPRNKYILKLKEKIKLSPDIYEFVFSPNKKFNFRPGQYIEWTFAHENPDQRGNRRYFTVASSPTEDDVKIGVRMNNPGSSFKDSLQEMKNGEILTAAQIAGDFILDETMPAVLIAGGIGVTPFRSMIKYLIDKGIKQDVTLVYFAKKEEDFVFKDIFDKAGSELGFKIMYIVSDNSMDLEKLIKEKIPAYATKKYYLSGPSAMVDSYKAIIHKLVLYDKQIVTDYFPGF